LIYLFKMVIFYSYLNVYQGATTEMMLILSRST
jgi:hypothetical protein